MASRKYLTMRIDNLEQRIAWLIARGDFSGAEALKWVALNTGSPLNTEAIEAEAVRVTNWLNEADIKSGEAQPVTEFPYARNF